MNVGSLSENTFVASYKSNTMMKDELVDFWDPPKNSAVQLAAAITASARIYMYPYLSREDCYYTDTDSVVLGRPLPEEVVSSSLLGKFKLEHRIMKGYFLAPKSYYIKTIEDSNIIKFKGPGKDQVNPEWFEEQYADLSRTKEVQVSSNFRINREALNINKIVRFFNLGIKRGNKRKEVYHDNIWVDTDPIDITDLSNLNYAGKQIIQSLKNELIQVQSENRELKEKFNSLAPNKEVERDADQSTSFPDQK